MSVLNLLTLLVLFTLKLVVTNASDLNQEPLEIIWHTVTQGKWGCEPEFGIPIDVRRYGMLENSAPGSDGWHGELIYLIYKDLGLWPYIEKGKWVNGGLPQLGNLQAHLDKVKDDISRKIPDVDFDGLGVLDFEGWFAVWDMNFISGPMGIYRTESVNMAKQRHPELTDTEIQKVAIDEYNSAARDFLEQTLLLAKELRPKAKWGYYIYPKCQNRKWDEQCNPSTYRVVQQYEWLAEASDVLYPSAYFNEKLPDERKPAYMDGAVHMARTWLDYIEQPHKPIYVYTSTTLNNHPSPMPYYSDFDLIASLGVAADLGVDGIIIWGNKYRKQPKSQCEREQIYLETKLGPYVQRLLDFSRKCSRDICNSKGRCVKDKVEVDVTKINGDLHKDHVYNLADAKESYHCRCYAGWKGDHCKKAE